MTPTFAILVRLWTTPKQTSLTDYGLNALAVWITTDTTTSGPA